MDSPGALSPEFPFIQIQPWTDAVVEAHGFGPRSSYVEHCLLPVVGPTAAWLYRRIGTVVELRPEGVRIDLVELSLSLGLGAGCGRHSLTMRALARLAHFEIVRWGSAELLVRLAVAPLTERQLARLPDSVRLAHARLIAEVRGPIRP